jgi:hypothetical protein
MSPQDWALSVFGRVPVNLIPCTYHLAALVVFSDKDPGAQFPCAYCPDCKLLVRLPSATPPSSSPFHARLALMAASSRPRPGLSFATWPRLKVVTPALRRQRLGSRSPTAARISRSSIGN